MENVLHFPPTTIVNKKVPKVTFARRADARTHAAVQNYMAHDFDTITWLYKLTAQTLNVVDGEQVHEIDVFACQMKQDFYNANALSLIDGLLPRHTLFLILYGDSCDIVMHNKQRRSDGKWQQGVLEMMRYAALEETPLRLDGQNMDSIYCGLLGCLSGLSVRSQGEYVEKAELRRVAQGLERQIGALQKKIRVEKQFNRQIAMNDEARKLKRELEEINLKL